MFDAAAYWRSVIRQDRVRLEKHFAINAVVRWHNTNEQFTAGEFIRANCDYPGRWGGELERIERHGDTIVTVVRIFSTDSSVSFHAVSFIRLFGEKIAELDEYWSEDGDPPAWRKALNLGRAIQESAVQPGQNRAFHRLNKADY